MTALLIVVAAIVLLFIGYVFYGSWLAKQWGIDPTKKTPAIEKVNEGSDYQDQYQKCEDDEKLLSSGSHGILDDLTYRFTVMSDRCE